MIWGGTFVEIGFVRKLSMSMAKNPILAYFTAEMNGFEKFWLRFSSVMLAGTQERDPPPKFFGRTLGSFKDVTWISGWSERAHLLKFGLYETIIYMCPNPILAYFTAEMKGIEKFWVAVFQVPYWPGRRGGTLPQNFLEGLLDHLKTWHEFQDDLSGHSHWNWVCTRIEHVNCPRSHFGLKLPYEWNLNFRLRASKFKNAVSNFPPILLV